MIILSGHKGIKKQRHFDAASTLRRFSLAYIKKKQ